MVIKSLFLVMMMVGSPIWPLGDNPVVGNPFIIVNKQTNELAFINKGKIQSTHTVATGISVDLTPEGKFTIVVKAKDPYYRKKDIPGGASENPLGTRWIGFDAEETDGRTYGIHGNNNPDSIGKYVTQGCVRMYEEEVRQLYDKVPIGTKIVIVNNGESFEQIGRLHGAMK